MITHIVPSLLLLAVPAILPAIAVAGVRPVTIFLSPLLGALMAGFGAELELVVGGTLVVWFAIIAACANLAAVLLVRNAWPHSAPNGSRLTWRRALLREGAEWRSPWPWITTLVVAAAAAWPLRALQVPIVAYDAKAIWTLHSLFIYDGHGMYLAALKSPAYAFSNPDYPPLVSASGALSFFSNGRPELHLAVSLTAILTSCALGVGACGMSSIVGKNVPAWTKGVAIGAGAAVCLIGFGVDEPYAVGGYADLLWAASALAAIVYGLLLPPSARHLAIGWMSATVAALTKNEGLTVALAILALMSVRYVPATAVSGGSGSGPTGGRFEPLARRVGPHWLLRVFLWVTMAAPALVWPLVMKYEGIRSDFFGFSSESLGERLHLTVSGVADNLHVLPVAAAIALAGGLTVKMTRTQLGVGSDLWMWTVVGWSLVTLTATYVLGGLEIHFWLSTSVSRTTVFAELALYADMAVWGVLAVTQLGCRRGESLQATGHGRGDSDNSVNFAETPMGGP